VTVAYEPMQLKPVASPDEALIYAEPGTTIYRTHFSPNVIGFSVTTNNESGRVYLNQNYVRGWHSTAGDVRLDERTGRAYVTVYKNRTRVRDGPCVSTSTTHNAGPRSSGRMSRSARRSAHRFSQDGSSTLKFSPGTSLRTGRRLRRLRSASCRSHPGPRCPAQSSQRGMLFVPSGTSR
jgi:hypothetical protein